MARITTSDLQEVITIESGFDPTPFITAASSLTDWVASKTSLLSSAQLVSIETFLAAHFYSCYDRRIAAERAGDASATYDGKSDMYLESTQYGQAAMVIDISGCLGKHNAELKEGKKHNAQMAWLGTVPSLQTHVLDRD